MTKPLPPKDIEFTINSLDGHEKKYRLVPLKRREAAQVFHNTLLVVVSAFAKASNTDNGDKSAALLEAISALNFDTLWGLAEKLLRFAIIDNEEIQDINETDYFTDNPLELYQAVYKAIVANYPGVFSKVQGMLKGDFNPLDMIKGKSQE